MCVDGWLGGFLFVEFDEVLGKYSKNLGRTRLLSPLLALTGCLTLDRVDASTSFAHGVNMFVTSDSYRNSAISQVVTG